MPLPAKLVSANSSTTKFLNYVTGIAYIESLQNEMSSKLIYSKAFLAFAGTLQPFLSLDRLYPLYAYVQPSA